MPEITINGVLVDFPFPPYDVQKIYMEKVIECLQKGVHGVLESPTGTGKTLSLLCASLGWLRVKKAQAQAVAASNSQNHSLPGLNVAAGLEVNWSTLAPKIIYASRTHTQLSQALRELKRTNYAETFRSCVIGSRDQLCINSAVQQEQNNTNKIHLCQRFVSARSCMFYNNVESRKEYPDFAQVGALDIEDLIQKGKKHKCCPYYMARELKNNADIIFMPYNYLLDPKARRANNIELTSCVVILDEAHNIEKMCEDAGSLQFRSTDIALCISEVTKVMKDLATHNESGSMSLENLSASVKDFNQEDLCLIKTMFLELEQAVDQITVTDEGSTFPGPYIFDLLAKAKITHGQYTVILEIVDKMVLYLAASASSAFTKLGVGLQRFSELLTVVFSQPPRLMSTFKNCYKVHITLEVPNAKKQKPDNWLTKKTETSSKGRVINYWCFSSSYGMQLLSDQGARCILLTSGTLSPIPALISELGIKVPVTLENGHVVTGEQVFVSVVSTGPDGTQLNSSYNTRNDPKYISSLGRTIQNLSRIVPGGLLVFFPSYPVLKMCQDHWQSTGIWPAISEQKPIFVESQMKESFANSMIDYYNKISEENSKGACFLAVCRGKVSEGLDFSDQNGRAVIITGLPYPPLKDPRVVLKQKYLDEAKRDSKKQVEGISGQQWYQLEASRAVNQAIGRVIRHRHDYGAIFLCDSRFGNSNFKQQLSAWLQPHIQSYPNFGSVYKGAIDFFRRAEKTLPCSHAVARKTGARQDTSSGSGVQKPSAVASGFDQARSRMVQRASQPAPLNDAQITENILSVSPSTPSPLQVSKRMKRNASGDLLSALSTIESAQVINFNDRVKVTMKLPEFTRAGSKKGSQRKLLLGPKSISTDTASSSKVANNVSKQDEIAAYWKNVKDVLVPDDYKTFVQSVKEYNKSIMDFHSFLVVLKKLFLGDIRHPHLFSGFSRFIQAKHKEEFLTLCNNIIT